MPALRSRAPAAAAGVLAVVLAGALPVVSAAPAQARTSCVPPPVAHRGASASAPENTRPAFRKALAGGVRNLEMDVHFSSDNVPVVIHDRTVTRTTNGTGAVAGLDVAALRRLDAGSWFGKAYRGTRVPVLREVLQDGKRYRARYFVELKVRPSPLQLQNLLAAFGGLDVARRVVVTSFDAAALADVRTAAPHLRTALVDTGFRPSASVLENGNAYLPPYRSVNAARARQWRSAGVEVFPWVVQRQRDWSRLAADRVSGTITDAPVKYLRWARARCS